MPNENRNRDIQIRENPDSYSHGRHVVSDAIRGFTAGMRGYLEGRKLRREAQEGREQRIADENYRQRALDLQERQVTLQDAFLHKQLGQQGMESEAERELRKALAEQADATARYEIEIRKSIAVDDYKLRELQTRLQNANAQEALALQREIAELEANLQWKRTLVDAETRISIANKQIEAGERTLETTGKQQIEAIKEGGEQARKTITHEQEFKLNEVLRKRGLNPYALLPGQREDYRKLQAAVRDNAAVKTFAEVREAYVTTMSGYLLTQGLGQSQQAAQLVNIEDFRTHLKQLQYDQQTGIQNWSDEFIENQVQDYMNRTGDFADPALIADIQMINGLQRMFDPGVSVREGDVGVLLSGVDAIKGAGAGILSLYKGGKFTPSIRHQIATIALGTYQEQYTATRSTLNNMLKGQGDVPGQIQRFGLTETLHPVTPAEFMPFENLTGMSVEHLRTAGNIFGRPASEPNRVPSEATTERLPVINETMKEAYIDGYVKQFAEVMREKGLIDDALKAEITDTIKRSMESLTTKAKVNFPNITDTYLYDTYGQMLIDEIINRLEGAAPTTDTPETPEQAPAPNVAPDTGQMDRSEPEQVAAVTPQEIPETPLPTPTPPAAEPAATLTDQEINNITFTAGLQNAARGEAAREKLTAANLDDPKVKAQIQRLLTKSKTQIDRFNITQHSRELIIRRLTNLNFSESVAEAIYEMLKAQQTPKETDPEE